VTPPTRGAAASQLILNAILGADALLFPLSGLTLRGDKRRRSLQHPDGDEQVR
jgi:hypothetical protein